MEDKYTKVEKIIRAKKLAELMKNVLSDQQEGVEIYWDNVWHRAMWILTD